MHRSCIQKYIQLYIYIVNIDDKRLGESSFYADIVMLRILFILFLDERAYIDYIYLSEFWNQ